ncbi:hypothetical protein ASPZODRAFT_15118 [Penicilliopsis zonata CBS 506.65]|uniref:Uncharacterized protein n=1 Tax=Penicilliopsis zonata CBS 506.65 TaxID=1073090 RepID=A0A1L9SKD9_9EURO|nr:hypothetical protein ASPZODRAFT_15118 [Penicilliopsis zonata CBS 506.65]OJJ47668.1 hypothetical protein ASPZODRAFT_15118 [Penicilliopsis zonata CBS 506.65]
MSTITGVPTYTSAPINTTTTAAENSPETRTDSAVQGDWNPPTTTENGAATTTSSAPAQPGSRASIPVETGIPLSTPTSTSSPPPPPPQPGAVPEPTYNTNINTAPTGTQPRPSVPPPPKAGQVVPPGGGAVPNSTSTPYTSVYQQPQQSYALSGAPNNTDPFSDLDDTDGFLHLAKSWVQSAGTKLAEVEAEVWKRINDAHN